MSGLVKAASIAASLVLAAAGVGAAGGAGAAGSSAPSATSADGKLRCEIQAQPGGGTLLLTGVVHAEDAVAGTYAFKVAGGSRGNSSNISQGGPFTAGAGAATTVGSVMLNADAAYDATLTVTVNGATVSCTAPK